MNQACRPQLPLVSCPLAPRLLVAGALLLAGACRQTPPHKEHEGPHVPIMAQVVPSLGDEHFALLPSTVQLLVQANSARLFAEPMLGLAAGTFLAAMSSHPHATADCLERLARNAALVTYAWIGGADDGWVAIADAPFHPTTVAACLTAFGAAPVPGTEPDPPIGQAYRMGANGDLLLARLGPERRAFGVARTVEAVRRIALQPLRFPEDPSGSELLPRLRQGDLKVYVDLDQFAALGGESFPLMDDVDRAALLVRLELMKAKVVTLVRARSPGAVPRVASTLHSLLSSLRRFALEQPGVPASSVYRVFDEAEVQRLDNFLRLQLTLDRPTLAALVGIVARQTLQRISPSGERQPPTNEEPLR